MSIDTELLRSHRERGRRAPKQDLELMRSAADHIDALEAENATLRQALQRIADWQPPPMLSKGEMVPMVVAIDSRGEQGYFREVARAALGQEQA